MKIKKKLKKKKLNLTLKYLKTKITQIAQIISKALKIKIENIVTQSVGNILSYSETIINAWSKDEKIKVIKIKIKIW